MVARLCDKYRPGAVAVCSFECLKFNTFTALLSIKVNSISVISRLRGLRIFREFHPT